MFDIFVHTCVDSVRGGKRNGKQTKRQNNKSKNFCNSRRKKVGATLVDNKATRALIELLHEGDVTVKADDYGGFEKVGEFGSRLPTMNEQIKTVPGDIILYQGTSICFYYSTNSWNFTRLGKLDINDEKEIREFLLAGKGRVDIVLSLK